MYNQNVTSNQFGNANFCFYLILKWSKWGLTKTNFLRSMRMN